MVDPRFGRQPDMQPPAQPQRPGGPPPARNLSDEDIRARGNYNLAEQIRNGKRPEAPPRTNPPVIDMDALRADLHANGVFANYNLREIATNLRAAGFDICCDIAPIGEKPIDKGGRAQARESRLAELETKCATLECRATTAEATAADAIRELNELKSQTTKET